MPDITMCTGEGCFLRSKCYRYTAKPNEYRQSFFVTPPLKGGTCDCFMPGEGWPREYHNEEKLGEANEKHT